jgi:uncharacterized protein YqeY
MIDELTIDSDMKAAMKSKDAEKLSTIRMVKAAITTYKIEKKKEILQESDLVQIIQKQAKQRRESIDSFNKAGRADLAEKESRELTILEAYLPKQLSADEVRTILAEAIARCGATTKNDLGKIMKDVMPVLKGKADGKLITELLGSLLP